MLFSQTCRSTNSVYFCGCRYRQTLQIFIELCCVGEGRDPSGLTLGLAPIGPRRSMHAKKKLIIQKKSPRPSASVRVRPRPSASAKYIKPYISVMQSVLSGGSRILWKGSVNCHQHICSRQEAPPCPPSLQERKYKSENVQMTSEELKYPYFVRLCCI